MAEELSTRDQPDSLTSIGAAPARAASPLTAKMSDSNGTSSPPAALLRAVSSPSAQSLGGPLKAGGAPLQEAEANSHASATKKHQEGDEDRMDVEEEEEEVQEHRSGAVERSNVTSADGIGGSTSTTPSTTLGSAAATTPGTAAREFDSESSSEVRPKERRVVLISELLANESSTDAGASTAMDVDHAATEDAAVQGAATERRSSISGGSIESIIDTAPMEEEKPARVVAAGGADAVQNPLDVVQKPVGATGSAVSIAASGNGGSVGSPDRSATATIDAGSSQEHAGREAKSDPMEEETVKEEKQEDGENEQHRSGNDGADNVISSTSEQSSTRADADGSASSSTAGDQGGESGDSQGASEEKKAAAPKAVSSTLVLKPHSLTRYYRQYSILAMRCTGSRPFWLCQALENIEPTTNMHTTFRGAWLVNSPANGRNVYVHHTNARIQNGAILGSVSASVSGHLLTVPDSEHCRVVQILANESMMESSKKETTTSRVDMRGVLDRTILDILKARPYKQCAFRRLQSEIAYGDANLAVFAFRPTKISKRNSSEFLQSLSRLVGCKLVVKLKGVYRIALFHQHNKDAPLEEDIQFADLSGVALQASTKPKYQPKPQRERKKAGKSPRKAAKERAEPSYVARRKRKLEELAQDESSIARSRPKRQCRRPQLFTQMYASGDDDPDVGEDETGSDEEGEEFWPDPEDDDPDHIEASLYVAPVTAPLARDRASSARSGMDVANAREEESAEMEVEVEDVSVREDIAATRRTLKALSDGLRTARLCFIRDNWKVILPFVSDERVRLGMEQNFLSLPATPEVREIDKQPETVTGSLRQYQIEGLNWLLGMHQSGVGAILGDEMGLGKTVQTIAFLAALKHSFQVPGPHLVVCPLSVMSGWMREFQQWCPGLRVVRFHGPEDERLRLKQGPLKSPGALDVCVTTYEMITSAESFFRRFPWCYIVLDEAQRVKNDDTLAAASIRRITCHSLLLLTGTPLQNDLHELWSLLNLLFPDLFKSSAAFDSAFQLNGFGKPRIHVQTLELAGELLRPLMLRRLKKDVETNLPPKKEVVLKVPLSLMQRFWYKRVLLHFCGVDFTGDVKDVKKRSEITRLSSVLTQLRKCCNHPFLFPGADPPPYATKEQVIEASNKLVLLDMLLAKLKKEGHKVLIFSLFTSVLDIIEEIMDHREYNYCRLDGSTPRTKRELDMQTFNAEGSDKFAYLLSTRAGGLGITLTAADVVIHFDSDFNPQVDLQAQDRCHRIGQDTVEERILARAMKKLFLGAVVTSQLENDEQLDREEMFSMIQFGANKIISIEDSDESASMINFSIDELLEKAAIVDSNETENLRDFDPDAEQLKPVRSFEGRSYTSTPESREDDVGGIALEWAALKRGVSVSELKSIPTDKQKGLGRGARAKTPSTKVKKSPERTRSGRSRRSRSSVSRLVDELERDDDAPVTVELLPKEGFDRLVEEEEEEETEEAEVTTEDEGVKEKGVDKDMEEPASMDVERENPPVGDESAEENNGGVNVAANTDSKPQTTEASADAQVGDAAADGGDAMQVEVNLSALSSAALQASDPAQQELREAATAVSNLKGGSSTDAKALPATQTETAAGASGEESVAGDTSIKAEPEVEGTGDAMVCDNESSEQLETADGGSPEGKTESEIRAEGEVQANASASEEGRSGVENDVTSPSAESSKLTDGSKMDQSDDEEGHVDEAEARLPCPCTACPRVYHLGCLESLGRKKAFCPQHSCMICSRASSSVGGVIFRCLGCTSSYCEDHLPAATEFYDNYELFKEVEFAIPSSAYYITCGAECKERSQEEVVAWKEHTARLQSRSPAEKWEDVAPFARDMFKRARSTKSLRNISGIEEQLSQLSGFSVTLQSLHHMLFGRYCDPEEVRDSILDWKGAERNQWKRVDMYERLYKYLARYKRTSMLTISALLGCGVKKDGAQVRGFTTGDTLDVVVKHVAAFLTAPCVQNRVNPIALFRS